MNRIEEINANGNIGKVYEGVKKKFGNFVCEGCGAKVFPNKLDEFVDNAEYVDCGRTSLPLWDYKKYKCKSCGNEIFVKYIPASVGGMHVPDYGEFGGGETISW